MSHRLSAHEREARRDATAIQQAGELQQLLEDMGLVVKADDGFMEITPKGQRVWDGLTLFCTPEHLIQAAALMLHYEEEA